MCSSKGMTFYIQKAKETLKSYIVYGVLGVFSLAHVLEELIDREQL